MLFKRLMSSTVSRRAPTNLFQLFPKTFPNAQIRFRVDQKSLRKEYRLLQQESHPDSNIDHGSELKYDDSTSSLLNKAYSTLKDSLARSQHILELNGIDLKQDEISKKYSTKDHELLFDILDIHENLENVSNETELEKLKEENDERIESSEDSLEQFFKDQNYEDAAVETIRLKYWWNIDNAIKNWEPGKPVNLTH
ncbi:DnaJ subfamily A member 3, mitochondrial [Wickerhamomyces ciferrii]|uniref:DnaJ subfamily A member 3, mitochondrial n=1 Tax=Wickerhamomyces ciferrii (strain ATCC 14091 / BCRC 22168 / CBS 111 / JCM 3599 / NBRC 0793 / NRRL Y-1031 F-60-10) TaxID=1206466 RepID=K0KH22_WICCF|nr:DnaJ subfamily A member 3, mitochondrial [Wickerhamomyces ciferrii]CCH44510.1 DnaJ subfamily A member 3, mitochondrial [Wickerhamomyces ciferrii]